MFSTSRRSSSGRELFRQKKTNSHTFTHTHLADHDRRPLKLNSNSFADPKPFNDDGDLVSEAEVEKLDGFLAALIKWTARLKGQ